MFVLKLMQHYKSHLMKYMPCGLGAPLTPLRFHYQMPYQTLHLSLRSKTLPTAQQATQIINSIPEIKNTHIVMQSSTPEQRATPRMGALNDIMPITDVIAINQHVFSRPIFAGNIIEKSLHLALFIYQFAQVNSKNNAPINQLSLNRCHKLTTSNSQRP